MASLHRFVNLGVTAKKYFIEVTYIKSVIYFLKKAAMELNK